MPYYTFFVGKIKSKNVSYLPAFKLLNIGLRFLTKKSSAGYTKFDLNRTSDKAWVGRKGKK